MLDLDKAFYKDGEGFLLVSSNGVCAGKKMSSNKPHLNMIVMGHVDHGKSTLTGHLLFDSGYIDQKTIDSYAKESEKTGAGDTFKFAWVLDTIKEERERGVTIDLSFQKF